MIKMFSGLIKNPYIFFQIGVYAHIHATFLVVERADRFLGQALYGLHFVADKEMLKEIFLSTFEGNVDLLQS